MTIDPAKVAALAHGLARDQVLLLLERALSRVPAEDLASVIDRIVPAEQVLADAATPAGLVAGVQAFHDATLAGRYYEEFFVTSKNCTELSFGTARWIAEFERLLAWVRAEADRSPTREARRALELLFDLVERLDAGEDQFVFWADEGGSWMLAVDWRLTLATYFRCLSQTATPSEYASRARATLRAVLVDHERPKFFALATQAATPEQAAALEQGR